MLNSNLQFSGPMLVLVFLGVYLFEFNETTLPLVEKNTKPNDSKHVLTATSLFWTFHVQHVRQLECMTGFLKERGLKEENLRGSPENPGFSSSLPPQSTQAWSILTVNMEFIPIICFKKKHLPNYTKSTTWLSSVHYFTLVHSSTAGWLITCTGLLSSLFHLVQKSPVWC